MEVKDENHIWPVTSTSVIDLDTDRFNFTQLQSAFDRKIQIASRSDPIPTPASSSSDLFHLHTFTLEINIVPPPPTLRYYRRQDEENPLFKKFTTLKDAVMSACGPLEPISLASGSRLVRSPRTSVSAHRRQIPSVDLFLPNSTGSKDQFVSLPPFLPNLGAEYFIASKAWDTQNWLHAALSLDPEEPATRKQLYKGKQLIFLHSTIKLCWVPDDDDADLKMLLEIKVHLDLDLAPLPSLGHDLFGLILHSLIPSPTSQTFRSEAEARAFGLRHFYDALEAAPDIPIDSNVRRFQPKGMTAKLLPFQTRTVARLLQQEKHGIPAKDPGQWILLHLGEHRYAYRRISGDLIKLGPRDRKGKGRQVATLTQEDCAALPVRIDLEDVKGTMLCEEMGLGKTVEAIALTLLNRHPASTPYETPIKKKREASTIDLAAGVPVDDDGFAQWLANEHKAFETRVLWDEQAQLSIAEVATTLIVTPPSLLKQWVSEIQRHAPTLRVCVYDGWRALQKSVEKMQAATIKQRAAKKRKRTERFRTKTAQKYRRLNGGPVKSESLKSESESDESDSEDSLLDMTQREFLNYVRAHDVVITTYLDVAKDLDVARPPPQRSRRATTDYQIRSRPRSPLVMVQWWRVVMDEVQLQSDKSNAANMVSLIPRTLSLAVSGTPARADIKDLLGSLKFLRVPVLPYNPYLWHRLQQSSMRSSFDGLFKALAVRTTKKQVAGEFNLPHQSRLVVPIELSEIERHYYNDTLQRQRVLLGLRDFEGSVIRPDDWALDRAAFRSALMNLRQICTHIQVGASTGTRNEQRLFLGRELMTMTEALEKMQNDHTQEFILDSRQQMRAMIHKAQLVMAQEDDPLKLNNAQLLYHRVRDRVTSQVQPIREHLYKLLGHNDDLKVDDTDDTPERQLSQQERDKVAQIQHTRQSIREMLIILHQSWFFEGDVHHQAGRENEEVECYAEADRTRKEILARALAIGNRAVEQMQVSLNKHPALKSVDELKTDDVKRKGGFLTNDTVSQANELLQIMNDNAELLYHWRKKVISTLSSPIEQDLADMPGIGEGQNVERPEEEFYAQALQAQGEAEAYLAAYAAALADRKEFMLEERSLLATHDARVTKKRITKAAQNAMEDVDIAADAPNEVAEQLAELMQERQAFRDARVEKDCQRPLKALLIALNSVVHGQNARMETVIASGMASMLREYISRQSEYVDSLNKELDLFRKTFNRRVTYFAALQEISDSVAAPEYKDLAVEIREAQNRINEQELKLARLTTRGRFLQYLGTRDKTEDEIRDDCIICMGSSDDTHAVLLGCGHFFCVSCFKEYRRSQNGRICPNCRVAIDDRQITRVKLAQRGTVEETTPVGASTLEEVLEETEARVDIEEIERQRRLADLGRLRTLDTDKRRDIALFDMMGEYGSKINFLIKHLLWYKSRDPSTRHVIFSNWSDSLNIVMRALETNGITFISFDQGGRAKDIVDTFQKDTSISVFLLHAERESSGLTLTSCSVVHLLEPVLKHSFELQAIGRVDRLGQDKETTVFCYATNETVESRILVQGVRNGTSIYLSEEEAGDDVVAEMPNVVSAAHKGGDLANEGDEESLLGLIL
ncbi:SNF2 family N-terminal domain-domain-containing protein [Naematelia encephala]|uniref:SNF2 family N-terminal domain-domain-containing protein n=1 Tax=Naematelia encephala TaxID=71784 RepID=A0A1Y2AWG7_9TREE|nr:SNF2 family N-terminal domain-domain-containing protein [Naematelia encephala]